MRLEMTPLRYTPIPETLGTTTRGFRSGVHSHPQMQEAGRQQRLLR